MVLRSTLLRQNNKLDFHPMLYREIRRVSEIVLKYNYKFIEK